LALAGLFPAAASAQFTSGYGDPIIREQSPGGATFMHGLSAPVPGHVWVGANGANHGLGYEGSYFSAGYMFDFWDDPWDGTWMLDARGHISAERGNFFGNLGFLRNVFFDAMGADVRVGIWYDIDDDAPAEWQHTMHQLSVSGEVLGELFDFRANGYLPVGDYNYRLGHSGLPLGNFVDNRFLAQTGIDNALRGFDVMGGIRPPFAEAWRGSLDLGGYYYRSDIVEPFGGFKGRVTIQPSPMLQGVFEVNHDRVYKTTGFLGVSMHFGSGAFGRGGGSPSGRGQELPRRNDHIVRFYQEPIFAINPNTGLLYRAIHVDNSNTDPNPDGSAENPYTNLIDAQNASRPDEVIVVHFGDGTTNGYDTGIVLKDRQFLIGEGGRTVTLPVQGFGRVSVGAPGRRPTLTNPIGPAVTLANNNEVAGLRIDDAIVGIFGTGITGTIGDQLLEAFIYDNLIENSFADGTLITQSQGDFLFQRNIYQTNSGDGVEMRSNFGTVVFNDNNQFLANNTAGATAGIHVLQEGGVGLGSSPFSVLVEDNTIEVNNVGVHSEADGAGSNLTTVVRENRSISGNADGVRLSSFNAGLHNASVIDNPVMDLNGLVGEGVAVRLLTGGTTGGVAVLNALVARNTFTNNIGDIGAGTPVIALPPIATEFGRTSGVYGFADGTSIMNVEVADNTFIDNLQNAIQFTFGGNNATNVSTVFEHDNLIVGQGGGSAYGATGNGRGDVLVEDEVIIGGTANQGFAAGGFGNGVLRWTLRDSSVTGHAGTGVLLRAADTGRLIARVEDVQSQLNLNGMEIQGLGAGIMVADILRSDFSLNLLDGVNIANTDVAQLFVFMTENSIVGNGQFDVIATNVPDPDLVGTPDLCLALYGNIASQFYQIANPFITNNILGIDLAGTFNLEFDNFNTPSPAMFIIFPVPGEAAPGPITVVPIGTCEAAVTAGGFRNFP
jgi:hypothetical protein